jgi:hypothetical protein
MRRGQSYQRWVTAQLDTHYDLQHASGLWLSYWNNGRLGAIEIDSLVIDISRGILYLIEVKHQHTPSAWEQMRNFYKPVLEAALAPSASHEPRGRVGAEPARPLWDLRLVEICNWCDLTGGLATGVNRIDHLEEARGGETFNVLVWRKK